ncbi:MAG: DUF2333 family protein [Gammaproteobacteria bacterium]|nr:DUF2333 family protein [Gammaproteobacteria bacterium]
MYWSIEPALRCARERRARPGRSRRTGQFAVGSVTVAILVRAAETLPDKPGGYLSNDLVPPSGVWFPTTRRTGSSAHCAGSAISQGHARNVEPLLAVAVHRRSRSGAGRTPIQFR